MHRRYRPPPISLPQPSATAGSPAPRSRRAVIGGALAACALTLCGGLAGCGWAPLYADPQTGAADADLRAIKVSPIPERIGQRLELALRNSLNPDGVPTEQRYLLRTTLTAVRSDLGIQSTGIGTLARLYANASFTLADIKTGKILLSRTSHTYESFDIVANQYSNVVAEDDARTRAAEELRADIINQLTLFFQRRAAEPEKPPLAKS